MPTLTAFLCPNPYTAARLFPYVLGLESFNFPENVQLKKEQLNRRSNSNAMQGILYHPSTMQVEQRKLPTYQYHWSVFHVFQLAHARMLGLLPFNRRADNV